jgi:flagellar motor component MotA
MLIIIGFLFSVFVSVVVSGLGGMGPAVLIDLPSVLLTLIFVFFFLFTSKSGSIIGRYIKSSFKKNYTYTKTELETLSCAIKNTVKFTLATGGFGFLTGLVATLTFLNNRNMLGPNIAISLFTVFYAIIVSYLIFFPVQAWAENKINTMDNNG